MSAGPEEIGGRLGQLRGMRRTMALIRPFHGLRYDLEHAGDANALLAPPYDVVDAAGRAEIGARSPNNCIHVILPEGAGDERYANGAARFAALQASGALLRDPEPGIYVYHQTFESEGQRYTRKGFVALIELTRFGAGPVLPHERTLSGPKEDRLKLMRACQAHLELVFGLFSDPQHRVEAALDPHLGTPVLEADLDGTGHRLFRVADQGAVDSVVRLLADRSIYIADGHHRYETMCSFSDELRAAGAGESARFGMIYLSNLDDPGLVVLPTHRVVHSVEGLDLAAAIAELASVFEIVREPLPGNALALRARLQLAGQAGAAFGLTIPGSGQLDILTLRAGFDPASVGMDGLPEALQRLDLALLHELVFDRGFGITREAQASKRNLRYYKSTEKALALARSDRPGDAQLVCFANATPVADVVAVCDSGEVMPQKSTFFFPKIPTGLVFHDLSRGSAE
ncbi:MAG TPA: DUF1015 domain-containing protein [Nannocystis exedens]|nr:DUF1015 domain-containing protein [Nannocystis exedens]